MTFQEFYSFVRETCNFITQKGVGEEMFRRPAKAPIGKKNFIEKKISDSFLQYFQEKHPDLNCTSWSGNPLQVSDTIFFWYPDRETDAIIPGGERQALFLEFKVFDKESDGHKGCDVSNAFVQLLQCMMMDSRQDKEGAVVVFDIWSDTTQKRCFDARPHDKEFVSQLQQMPCARNIHLVWIWFDRALKQVRCDMCPREGKE